MASVEFSRNVIGMQPSLKPFALKLTRDLDDAEDLIQETMFRAFSNEDKFQSGTKLKAWLYTIMKNIFINNYRKKVKRNTIIDTSDNLFIINSGANVSRNLGETSFVNKDIERAILGLSNDFRVPFMMHFRGYKYHEIAEKLNLPLGTVKSRIFFARKALKDDLEYYKDMF
ncbi:MAG: RNA polymerase sigma factor [Chitinophagales bacterium]|nr:RNA polymerase sigma factor [Chitinophagales bacterium]